MGFYIGFYAFAIIGHTQADQLLPQLFMEQPLANFVCGGVYCFHVVHACVRVCVCASMCASVSPSVRNVLFP